MGDFMLGSGPAKSQYNIGGSEESKGLMSQMYQRSMGQGGPSAAELMMNRGMGQQIAAGQAAAAGMRGVSPGMAARLSGQQRAQAMTDTQQQTGIMRAQEQAQAQSMLANYLQNLDRMRLEQDMYNAASQQRTGMLGSLLSAGGAIGGAMLGGPMGAAAGGALGGALGGGMGGGGSGGWYDQGGGGMYSGMYL